MLQAMNTGHDGSVTTVHANSPRDALSRIATMVMMSGVELPHRAIQEQTASAINLIVQQERLRDGSRRITRISEVGHVQGDVIALGDVFEFRRTGVDAGGAILGHHRATGYVPAFVERMREEGENVELRMFRAKEEVA
jgi:pilus assembly protein CpaF